MKAKKMAGEVTPATWRAAGGVINSETVRLPGAS